MTYKRNHIIIIFFFFLRAVLTAQCPWLSAITSDASMPNSCISYKTFAYIANTSTGTITAIYDYGDLSPIVTTTYVGTSGTVSFPQTTHSYPGPGTYVLSFTVNGPGMCTSSMTTNVVVTGECASCPTYSNISTGFDRINNIPFAIAPYASGSFDPYWYVVRRQDISSGPSYTPIPGTIVNYSNINAYDIYPSLGNIGPMGTSRHISINPTSNSVYQTLNIVTYRTYFKLPNPIPANKTYSLVFAIRADDAIYQVQLNGTDIKPVGYFASGGSYIGSPLTLTVASCSSSLFRPDSNFIDIMVSDLGLMYTHLDAEILLYQCSASCPPPCADCISSFAPVPGKKYILSAWAKENSPAQSKTNYNYPGITVLYPSISGSSGPFAPSGNIIDGWQRIEGEFTIPSNATDLTVKLDCANNYCYYDDIRILPFDGSMKSYVYDPITMRLVAELDERNYATLYEYDEEGKLIRVKKETEKGKMTIKENRDNTKK